MMRQIRCRSVVRSFAALIIAVGAIAVASVVPSAQIVSAGNAAQAGNNACIYNGTLIVPAVDAAHPYGWGFVANFDHSESTTAITTCLAERFHGQLPSQTRYTVASHCRILDNKASIPIGGGFARLDGNAVISCELPVPETLPDLFWIRAGVYFPNASQAYTILASDEVTFAASTDARCALTLSSRYHTFSFEHSGSATCGKLMDIGTRLRRESGSRFNGSHKIGKSILGPVTNNDGLSLPAGFTFTIGAAGQPYTLDWFAIDPVPSRCCSPG